METELEQLQKKQRKYIAKIIWQCIKLGLTIWLLIELYIRMDNENVSGKTITIILALYLLSRLKIKFKI